MSPGRQAASCSVGGPTLFRHDYKLPGEPDLLPEPDAIIVAPATFNTINKWAAGIADTLALGLLCEATGKGLPVVVLPYLGSSS
jgi:hypothetical protein